MKKVFLDDLPRWGKSGHGNEGSINWKEINTNIVEFEYNDIKGELILEKYNELTNKIIVKYKNYDYVEILIGDLKSGHIGSIFKRELFIKKYEIIKSKNKYLILDVNTIPLIKNGNIDWITVANTKMKLKFKHIDIYGIVQVMDYIPKKQMLKIKYLDKYYEMVTTSFFNCSFSYMLNIISSEYRYNLNDIIDTTSGKIEILKQVRMKKGNSDQKCYKYKCLLDGYIGTISERDIKTGNGCPCCTNKKCIKGINDAFTTHPHLIKYFKNIEDAYTHTYGSNKFVIFKCPDCGFEKKMRVSTLSIFGFSCNQCGDGISYPNKVIFNVLKQLIGIKNFNAEKQFIWSKNIHNDNCKLKGNKQYDFYFRLNDKDILIEAHGNQHYEESFGWIKEARTLEEEINNDKIKEELALQNGINKENYIVIDCRKSKLEFIKQNILNSKLNELFNLDNINWFKVEEFSLHSRIKEVSEYWNSGIKNLTEISIITGLEKSTVKKYINKGLNIGWNDYDGNLEHIKSALVQVEKLKKGVFCIENNLLFESCHDLDRKSEEIFGFKISFQQVSRSCLKKALYKGYTFKYISDLSLEEYIKYDIENKIKELHKQELVQAV